MSDSKDIDRKNEDRMLIIAVALVWLTLGFATLFLNYKTDSVEILNVFQTLFFLVIWPLLIIKVIKHVLLRSNKHMGTSVTVFRNGKQIILNRKDISNFASSELVEIYRETAILHDMINDLGEMIALGAVSAVNGITITGEFVDRLGDGWAELRNVINNRFGEDSAKLIFNKIEVEIKEIKASE